MMSVNQLLNKIGEVQKLTQSLQTAEKARVESIKNEANRLFKICYEEFNNSQALINSLKESQTDFTQLHVELGEVAYETQNYDISQSIISKFLQSQPQKNQYFCRAKCLLGLLLNVECTYLNGVSNIKYHKDAIIQVMEALEVAILPNNVTRYKFLIFNISITFWKIIHPFLRTSRAKFFVNEIKDVISALEMINDDDKNWRIMYLCAGAYCYDDDKQTKPAIDYIDKAIEYSEILLTEVLKKEEIIELDFNKTKKEVEEIMSAFRKIEDYQELLNKPPKIDPDADDNPENNNDTIKVSIPPLEGLASEGYEKVKEMLDESQAKKAIAENKYKIMNESKTKQMEDLMRLYMQRIHLNPSDMKRFIALPNVMKYLRIQTLAQCQMMMTNASTTPNNNTIEKENEGIISSLIKKINETKTNPQFSVINKTETLLDLCRYSFYLKFHKIGIACLSEIKSELITLPVLRIKYDICDGLQSLYNLSNINELMNHSNARLTKSDLINQLMTKRISIIKLFERTLSLCLIRLNDPILLQELCLIIWNACLPLLQSHTHMKVYSSLRLIRDVCHQLSFINQLPLQSIVHYELCKCENEMDFVILAQNESINAIQTDFGSIPASINLSNLANQITENMVPPELDVNRSLDVILNPLTASLKLRASVYSNPSTLEGKLTLLMQQVKESKSKPQIYDLINKAAYILLQEIEKDPAGSEPIVEDDTDLSIIITRKGVISIPIVSLEKLQSILSTAKAPALSSATPAAPPATKGAAVTTGQPDTNLNYSTFTKLLHTRLLILHDLVQTAHLVKNSLVLQQAACVILSYTWDSTNPLFASLIDQQINCYYLLADSLVERIASMPASTTALAGKIANDDLSINSTNILQGDIDDVLDSLSEQEKQRIDARSLGINSIDATPDMIMLKQLVLLSLKQGTTLAVAMKDIYAIQNGIIYFWNLHLFIFRNNYLAEIMDECVEFLKLAVQIFDQYPPVAFNIDKIEIDVMDDKLRYSIIDAMVDVYTQKDMLPVAIELCNKSITSLTSAYVHEYYRKKTCEKWIRILINQQLSAAANTIGGKAAPPKGGVAPGVYLELPKIDNIFLTVYSLLTQAEIYILDNNYNNNREQLNQFINSKIIAVMENELVKYVSNLPWSTMQAEVYLLFIEMQVECWTRCTRLKIILNDILGAQNAIEKCLQVVQNSSIISTTNGKKNNDKKILNPKIYRWLSIVERLFGIAITNIITSNQDSDGGSGSGGSKSSGSGQDINLQNDLRIIALQHFSISCEYGHQAAISDLILNTCGNSWNTL
eukprot:gene14672-19710_t